jgi:hypothetical protein
VCILSLATAAGATPGPSEIRIDCDRGGDLQAALRRAKGSRHTVIRLTGTCVGSFVVTSDAMELVGSSPEQSRIVGDGGSALIVRKEGWLGLRNIGVSSDHIGIDVEGAGRIVDLEECEIFSNTHGIQAGFGARISVRRSMIHSNTGSGVAAGAGADLWVSESVVRDNGEGVRLVESTLLLHDTEVTGNAVVGVLAESVSTVRARGTTFHENAQGHVGVTDRSTLSLWDSSVGRFGDTSAVALGASGNSRIEIYHPSGAVVHGELFALTGSSIIVDGADLEGGVTLQDFSWIKLAGTHVSGLVECTTGSAAVCEPGALATVSGCGDTAASCDDLAGLQREIPTLLAPRSTTRASGSSAREARLPHDQPVEMAPKR